MSDIEFLISDFKEKDKQELHEIEKKVKEKPLKNYKETVFLKRFVLAMMKQYYIPKHNGIKNLQQQINVAMPDIKHIIPHIMPKAPPKLDLMPKTPSKLNLFGEVPTPKVRQEIPVPKKNLLEKDSAKTERIEAPKPHEIEVPRPAGVPVPKPHKHIEVPRPV